MEQFYLEKVSMERKDKIIDYLDEFKKCNSDMNGTGSLDKIYDGYTFEETLDKCLKMEDEVYAKSINRCPGKTFLLMRGDDDKIVGMINVRWNLTDEMKKFGGNIGYSIRPTERRKGYNKINLYLALEKCQEFGIENAILTCKDDNVGSYKTMESFGVIPEEYQYDDFMVKRYIIPVDETLKEYEDVYSQSRKKQR